MASKERFYSEIMAMHPGVTGSCHLVNTKLPNDETISFLVDCGLFQEREYEKLNTYLAFDPEDIDFVLVTHNHIDHTGRLPFIVKNGFYKDIYATKTTTKLMPLALRDSYKVLKDMSKRKRKKMLYNEEDVSKTLTLRKECNFNETIKVNNYIKVTFLKNGHLLGAALILVQISYPGYDDINLLFTGDYDNRNMFFDVDPIPEWILDLPLTIIQESTYGDMESSQIVECFKENVQMSIENDKTVIAPVFSLGRSQEILYELKCMQNDGALPLDVPIYLDGRLAIEYTNLYINDGLDIKEEMRDFLPQNLTCLDKSTRGNVISSKTKKIALITSGMGSYGPAQLYLPQYIGRPDTLIHFTGYTAENTLGWRLRNANLGSKVEIGGLVVKKKAQVEYTSEYSAHAKADEMIKFLQQFNNIKLILVNHGETQTKRKFADRILDEVDTKNVGLLGEKYFFRVNPYGLVKTIATKFE